MGGKALIWTQGKNKSIPWAVAPQRHHIPPQMTEVTVSLLVSLFYMLMSRAGPQDQTPGSLVQGHNKGMLPCCKAPECHGAPTMGSAPTFLSLIAVNPNVALRADAEEGGLINPGQAGAPILTVVHVTEVTWKQSHVSLQAIPRGRHRPEPHGCAGSHPVRNCSPVDAAGRAASTWQGLVGPAARSCTRLSAFHSNG